ncbi:DUF7521 family protein [Halobaculum sp. P14]|uniref:DUF7521 family protein n=1 Tax=Halobaculum sp. P14 TaxID=3421638 RepID=UPI003EBD24FD
MSVAVDTAIVAVKTVILLLGSAVTLIAYRASRRTKSASLRLLSVGFGVITLGALLAGIANQLLSVSIQQGVLINSLLVAIGLSVILYSLYHER